MTSLQNGNYNSRSMNGLTTINANDINCDVINTIDANVANKLKVGVEAEMDGTLSVAGVTTAAQINATGLNVSGNADILGSLDVSGNVDISGNLAVVGITDTTTLQADTLTVSGNADISGNLAVVGITDTTRLQADNLILGGATYNAGIQIKADGIMLLGNRANNNIAPRVLNVHGDNALIDISRYSPSQPGFQLRNYDPATNVLRQDVLFLGPPSYAETWTWLFRSPGAGGDFFGGQSSRTRFDYYTPLYVIPTTAQIGTAFTARYRDATTTNNVDIVLNPNASDFSSIVQAGDAVILNSTSGRTLTLTTNNTSGCGIRMNSTISVGGATTFSNGITANSGITIASAGISTSVFKSSTDLRIDGNQASSRLVVRNRDSGGTDYATCVLATTENRFLGGEFTFRNTTATTGDAVFRMVCDTNNVFIEPVQLGSSALKNLRFRTNGGSIAHLGIDSVDGSVVIATNTPATGCKLTVNGKTQTIDLDVSGNLAIPTYPNVKSTLDGLTSGNILVTSDNTSGTYYLPFVKTAGTSTKALFIDDDATNPLTYIPNTGRLKAQIMESGEAYPSYIKTPSAEIDKITFYDGETMRSYSQQSVNDIDIANYMSGTKATKYIKITTYDFSIANNTATLYAPNILVFGLLRLTRGVTYTGVYFQTGTMGVNLKVVLYRSGLNPIVLAQRTTNYTTTAVGFQFVPFDAPYTPTITTDQYKYAYVGFVSSSNVAMYTVNNNLTNFGFTGTPNKFDLVAFSIPHTYANAFPSPYSGTPTALNLKYHLGLY